MEYNCFVPGLEFTSESGYADDVMFLDGSDGRRLPQRLLRFGSLIEFDVIDA